MKKLTVHVKDKNTIVLDEPGNQGDYIDLTSLSSIDTAQIETLIEEGKERVYAEKLAEYKEKLDLKHQSDLSSIKSDYEKTIMDLNNKIENEKKEYAASLSLQKKDIDAEYEKKIIELQNKIDSYESAKNAELEVKNAQFEIEKQKLESLNQANIEAIKQAYIEKINELNSKISSFELEKQNDQLKLKEQHSKEVQELKDALIEMKRKNDKELSDKQIEIAKLEADYKEQLQKKDNDYALLQRQKASLNVKQTGEDLESWCNNEMKSYRQTGLFNTTWTKDNEVIKEDGETKGSKADYIFRIYVSEEHKPEEELASVCLDMKDENPDSVHKQTNEHYYKDLDKNRKKKNCKYAVLVSNLETDKPNDLPVWKAEGYDDMYVVRPAYMMSFLSILTSLTTKFRDLLLEGNQERLELMSSIELKDKFEELKGKYLDKPLESLSKSIENIRDQSAKLKQISQKVDEECDKITRNYLNEIENKLMKFEIETEKAYRKYEKKVKVI